MKILGPTSVTAEVAQAWARDRGALDLFVLLAPLYWRYAPDRGVKPEVAYAQAAKETAFGQFGGAVTPQFRNPCGLKVVNASGDEPSDHQRFPTWEVGVQAHLDHLALYAGALGYPRPGSPDPRHFDFLLGEAASVESLGGAWAPSASYGFSLLADYITPLLATDPPAAPPAPEYATVEMLNLTGADVKTLGGELEDVKRVLGEVHRAIVDAGNRLTQSV